MKFFYLSSKPNSIGKFEVHEKECQNIPEAIDRDYLGPFNNGREALRKATQIQEASVCCEVCCGSGLDPLIVQSIRRES
jgi:hypothetical protein